MIVRKIVFTGPKSAGKTQLIEKIVNPEFSIPSNYKPTIGVDFKTKKDKEGDSYQLWDMPEVTAIKSLEKISCRDANVAVFCFDLTETGEFNNALAFINKKMEVFRDSSTNLPSRYILVGTKSDLESAVRQEEINELIESAKNAHDIDLHYIQTSAKTGKGVDELFEKIHKYVNNPEAKIVKSKKASDQPLLENTESETHPTITPTIVLGIFSGTSGVLCLGLAIAAVATALLLPVAWPIALGVGAGAGLITCGLFAGGAYACSKMDESVELNPGLE